MQVEETLAEVPCAMAAPRGLVFIVNPLFIDRHIPGEEPWQQVLAEGPVYGVGYVEIDGGGDEHQERRPDNEPEHHQSQRDRQRRPRMRTRDTAAAGTARNGRAGIR